MKELMSETKSITPGIKNKVKNFPFLYEACRFVLNPGFRFYPLKRNKALKRLLEIKEARILNIGSGPAKTGSFVVNTDICAFENVDVVSDAHALSFKNESFEGALLDSVIEHVSNPGLVVREAFRVLRKGGILFAEIPFMYEFHHSPMDYYRFTLPGISILLKDFEKIDSGISVGPAGTLNAVLRNYFALIFSFGIPVLYEFLNMFFGLFLFPLKILDFFLIRLNCAQNISSAFYFIGRKPKD